MILRTGQFKVRTAEIHFTGNNFKAFKCRFLNFFQESALSEQYAVGAVTIDFFQAQPAGGICLRIEIEKQDPSTNSGDTGGKIYSRGGLPDPAFLVGDGNDFGWHSGGVIENAT
jgi:hypothetical protein